MITRRIFVVPMANNNHGKSTIIKAMVSQGSRRKIGLHKKGSRKLLSPWGRNIDAYIFGRSYQEVERKERGSVISALNGNDPEWRTRELIVMPSHVEQKDHSDIKTMIDIAHSAGFDVIAVPVILVQEDGTSNRSQMEPILQFYWDARWTILNNSIINTSDQEGHLQAIGHDLWSWICRTLAS